MNREIVSGDEKYQNFEATILSDEFVSALYGALRLMGKKNLRKQYRHLWDEQHPYQGYCYVVTELLYHLSDKKLVPKNFPTPEGRHWYLEMTDGTVLDLTADKDDYDYSQGKIGHFMTTNMSTRTKQLKELMGL